MIKKELGKMTLVMLPMVLTPAFNMLFLVIVARKVSVVDYGSLAYAITLIAILVGFSDLGLRDFFLSKGGLEKRYVGTNVLLLFSSLIFLLILLLQYMFWVGSENNQLLVIFSSLIAEGYALGVLHKVVSYRYQANNRLPYFSKLDAMFKVLPIAVKLTIFISLGNLLLSLILGAATGLVIYTIWLLRVEDFKDLILDIGDVFNKIKILCSDWREWGVFTISFVSFFLYFGADKLIIQSVLGVEQLAIYSAAMAFMAIGQIAVGVLWSLYMPRLSKGENLWSYKIFILLLTGLGFLTCAGYQVLSYWIYGYIYPEAYAFGSYVLSLASVYFLFRFPNVVLEIFYIVDGHYSKFVKMRVLFGIFAVVLCYVLLPLIGIIGAVLALVTAEMLLMIGSLLGRRNLSC